MKLLSALVLSTTLAFGGIALAQESGTKGKPHHGKHHGGDFFKKVDTNNDGVITKEEHRAHSDKMFAKLDRNNDGKVTKDEARAGHTQWKEKQGERGRQHDSQPRQAVIHKGSSELKSN